MRLLPAADEFADFIECPHRMLIAAPIDIMELDRQPEKEPEFLDTEIRARKMPLSVARIGGFHKRFEHVEGRRLDSVAEDEFLAAGKFLDYWNEPKEKPEMRLDGGTRGA